MATSKKDLQAKIERIHSARMQVEAFVAAGGDLQSKEAAPIGVELAEACSDLIAEFDHPVLETTKP